MSAAATSISEQSARSIASREAINVVRRQSLTRLSPNAFLFHFGVASLVKRKQ